MVVTLKKRLQGSEQQTLWYVVARCASTPCELMTRLSGRSKLSGLSQPITSLNVDDDRLCTIHGGRPG